MGDQTERLLGMRQLIGWLRECTEYEVPVEVTRQLEQLHATITAALNTACSVDDTRRRLHESRRHNGHCC